MDEPEIADAVASSSDDEALNCEQPAIGIAANPISTTPATNPLTALPRRPMQIITFPLEVVTPSYYSLHY